MAEPEQVSKTAVPWGAGQARAAYWGYEEVITAEGTNWRVFDPMDRYQGVYHREDSARAAVWEQNRMIAQRDGKLLVGRAAGNEFIWIGACLGKLPGLGSDLIPGQIVRNSGFEAIWVDQERFDAEFRVFRG
jgi:hypothetical protein